jgi:ornithine cyclodeaminase/alanine dehydrogenase-like protein (mu-crystallin family)
MRPRSRSPEERTIYKSMGHAMGDSVTANLVYRLVLEREVEKKIWSL